VYNNISEIALSKLQYSLFACYFPTMVSLTRVLCFLRCDPQNATNKRTNMARVLDSISLFIVMKLNFGVENVQIMINTHASLSYMLAAVGINVVPSMELIYAIFGILVTTQSYHTALYFVFGYFLFVYHFYSLAKSLL
jgi:hypothetical protein